MWSPYWDHVACATTSPPYFGNQPHVQSCQDDDPDKERVLIDRNSPCKTSEHTSRIPCTQHWVNRASSDLLPIQWHAGGDGYIWTIPGRLVRSCRADIHVWNPYRISGFRRVLWTRWTRISVILGHPDCLWEMPSGSSPIHVIIKVAGIYGVDKRWSSMSWSWTLFTQMGVGVVEVCTSYTPYPRSLLRIGRL